MRYRFANCEIDKRVIVTRDKVEPSAKEIDEYLASLPSPSPPETIDRHT